jgi:hypothetical protein
VDVVAVKEVFMLEEGKTVPRVQYGIRVICEFVGIELITSPFRLSDSVPAVFAETV